MIYIERTITIKKNQAKIKEPIVLYKGDMNIELQFTIENNPFKYKAGMDVTYGQLVIKRPTAEPIFSEPAKMSSSRVIFIVTGDMIDELTEIGVYDFQIQLLNSDMTSRGSLPPVIGGIDIREPLCEKAMVNRASVNDANTYVMPGNDNIATFSLRDSDALFDEDGDYNRTNWNGGDIITDTKLNKIEEALYMINNDIPTDYATEMYVDDRDREIRDYIIDNYATISYVNDQRKATERYAESYTDNAIERINLNDYATEDYVTDSITNNNRYIENVILNDYVTQDYVDDAMKNIEGIEGPMGPQGPQGEVGPQGPQGEPGKDGKDADPVDLTGYATEDYVNEAIGNIEIPEGGGSNLDIMILGSQEEQHVITGDEFTEEDYMSGPNKTVFFKNVAISYYDIELDEDRRVEYNNQLVYIEFCGYRCFTVLSQIGENGLIDKAMYRAEEDGRIFRIEYTEYATKSYVDQASNIITIGNEDGSEYRLTCHEFYDEKFELYDVEGKNVLFKNTFIDYYTEDGEGPYDMHYDELVYIEFGTVTGPFGESRRYSIRSSRRIVDLYVREDAFVLQSEYEYAVNRDIDFVNEALWSLEERLGDIDAILDSINGEEI